MNVFEIIRLIVLSIPFGMFIMYLFFIGIAYVLKAKPMNAVEKRLFSILTIYSILVCISDLMISIYYSLPDLFDHFHIIYCASASYTIIVFYHFFCFATQPNKKFCLLHYLVPVIACAVLLVIEMFFSDFRSQEENRLSLWTALVFCMSYALISLYKMYRFQLTLSVALGNTDAVNNERALSFVLVTLLYPLALIVFQLAFGPEPGVIISLLIMAGIVLALMMNILLAFGIICHYADDSFADSLFFVSAGISIAGESDISGPVETVSPKVKRTYHIRREHRITGKPAELNRSIFEQYFCKEKPYLNPNLKIYDLVKPLQSNRTYISRFVNRTYHMNFTSYINLCRLKEMKRLLALPSNKKNRKNITKLALQAGFSNYDSYYRAKCRLADRLNES